MNTKTQLPEVQESVDLLCWIVMEAIEMNPDSAEEIESAWSVVMKQINGEVQ